MPKDKYDVYAEMRNPDLGWRWYHGVAVFLALALPILVSGSVGAAITYWLVKVKC